MLKDRQLLVSPEVPSTLGVVTDATDSAFRCGVLFRGKQYVCYSAGKNTLAVNDLVSFWEIDGFFFCAKADAGYPTRFKRPLIEWAATHSHNLLLQYCVRKQANIFTYRIGAVEAVASEFSLIVGCWDGMSRECRVEYAAELRAASAFAVGEAVVLYQKPTKEWIVIGRLATITTDPASIDFGDTPAIVGGSPVAVAVGQTGSTAVITATATNDYRVSASMTGTYSSSVTISGTGGILWIKPVPQALGARPAVVELVSSDARAEIEVDANGKPGFSVSWYGGLSGDDFGGVIYPRTSLIFGQYGTPIPVCDDDPVGVRVRRADITSYFESAITASCTASEFLFSLSEDGPWESTVTLTGSGSIYIKLTPVHDGVSSDEYYGTGSSSDLRYNWDWNARGLATIETELTPNIIFTGSSATVSQQVLAITQRLTTGIYVTNTDPATAGVHRMRGYGTYTFPATFAYNHTMTLSCRGRIRGTITVASGGERSYILDGVNGPYISINIASGYEPTTITFKIEKP